jgi:hypothetical protein
MDYHHRTIQRNDRIVDYTIVEPERKENRSTAVVIFYPLSGCAEGLVRMNVEGYRCSVLMVNRPLCGDTSPPEPAAPKHDEIDPSEAGCCRSSVPINSREHDILHRIREHAQDVLKVLQSEQITTVYVVGVCIGHPYAVEVCRQLKTEIKNETKLGGLALVAPLVSTVCPSSWRVARFGAWVPSSVLHHGTELLISVGNCLEPHILRPSAIKRIVTPEEQEMAGWKDEDFEDVYQMIVENGPTTRKVKAVEARLGVSKIWQTEVCDKFAVEFGFGLQLGNDKEGIVLESSPATPFVLTAGSRIPIKIYACKEDKLATLSSVEWVSRRCYGNTPITMEENIHSHTMMTIFGGPPRSPLLLDKIAGEWNLLDKA